MDERIGTCLLMRIHADIPGYDGRNRRRRRAILLSSDMRRAGGPFSESVSMNRFGYRLICRCGMLLFVFILLVRGRIGRLPARSAVIPRRGPGRSETDRRRTVRVSRSIAIFGSGRRGKKRMTRSSVARDLHSRKEKATATVRCRSMRRPIWPNLTC